MPSLPDTAVIIVLGLLLFGPKGLAQIARQLGKLMAEFRRASNEFRMQMEEELRIAEQADKQKQIAAIEAAAPVPPALPVAPVDGDHSHLPAGGNAASTAEPLTGPAREAVAIEAAIVEPVPIAQAGNLRIMPPATGLPAPRTSSVSALLDAVPKAEPPAASHNGTSHNGTSHNGTDGDLGHAAHSAAAQRPMRYTNHTGGSAETDAVAAGESLHG